MFAGTKKKFLTSGKEEKGRGAGGRRGEEEEEKKAEEVFCALLLSLFPSGPRQQKERGEGPLEVTTIFGPRFLASINAEAAAWRRLILVDWRKGGGKNFLARQKSRLLFFKKKSRRQVSFLFCGCLQFCFATLRFKRPQRTDDTCTLYRRRSFTVHSK